MPSKRPPRHPLRAWIDRQPDFRFRRDTRKVFGVTYAFLFRVLLGRAHPSPERARTWERLTGIPAARLVHPRWKEFFEDGKGKRGRVPSP